MRTQAVDGGRLFFERATGTNLLVRSPATAGLRRSAPRVLQIGLLTPCNLACEFCYRDTSAPSLLTKPFLLDLLAQAADWGVLEIAFGGGEPLLFDDFAGLLRGLHQKTPLGLNFTTNGTLLTPSFLDDVGDAVGEIRVSAYLDNGYRRTLRLLRGRNFGVNWLVTPDNVGLIEPVVHDCLALGARNVLLLGYKGADASLHLGPKDLDVLSATVRRRADWPILLDVCWHPLLQDVPQLFAKSDCGAGDEFLVITPDRAVQPCSFHHERIPFETFADLQEIYAQLKIRRAAACIGGCTRASFREQPQHPGVFVWRAHASNNSGSYTVLGRFATTQEAERAAASLRVTARAHTKWLQTHPDFEHCPPDGPVPTPPLREFARAHGFEWGEGLWWEDDNGDAPPFSAHVMDDTVVVHHPYAMSGGWENFRTFFAAVGATANTFGEGGDFRVGVTAKGGGPAVEEIERYFETVRADDYKYEAEPPWGKEARDPRLHEHDDRNAEVFFRDSTLERTRDGIELLANFENPFAGALAIESWLKREGFRDIVTRLQVDLWDSELAERVANAGEEELARLAFKHGRHVVGRIAEIDKDRLAELWQPLARGADFSTVLDLVEYTGNRAWLDRVWSEIMASDECGDFRFASALLAVLPRDEAVQRMRDFIDAAPDRALKEERLCTAGHLGDSRVLDWIEEFVPLSDDCDVSHAAELCGITWDRIRSWYERGWVELAGSCLLGLTLSPEHAPLVRKIRDATRDPELKEELNEELLELRLYGVWVFIGWGVPTAAIVLATDWSPWLKVLAACVLLPVAIAVVRLVNRWVGEYR